MNAGLRIVFISLCLLFVWYTLSIYSAAGGNKSVAFDSHKAASGRLVWQKYNCQVCHQLYGLGGYLGPDLTNVYSAKGKGGDYIKAIVISGTKQMPGFQLAETEMGELLEFLKSTDNSGSSDPRNFKTQASGMIEQNGNK
jgi:nitric oxide reductase subunit C